ncbi:hypothetical protein ACFL3T_04970 [Patescibacteria group bacterium]
MKSLFSKVALIGLATSLLAFVGCTPEGLPAGKSPEDVITEALLNQGEITESVYEITGTADLEGEVDGEMNNLDGNLRLAGSTNTEKGTMVMTLTFDAVMNEDGVKAQLEVRSTEDGVFIKISNVEVSDEESQELVELMLEEYLDKWVQLTFMTNEDVVESGYAEIDYKEGEPLPFKNIEYVGTTDVLGLNSYHFTADIDEKLLLSMMGDASTAEAQEFFDAATIKGDVYVAVNEMVISGFGGTITLNDPEMKGVVEMQVKVNPTRSDSVTTPTAEVEFTEEDMGALLFGGMMMDPSMGGGFDESMMTGEEGEMTDEEFEAMMAEFEDFEMPEGDLIETGEVPELIAQ